jgi:hypothetical protein
MLLRAMLLQAFYSIRSERQLMERLEFDLLFRWFVGLGVEGAVWDHSTFSKNRDRLLDGEIPTKQQREELSFVWVIVRQARVLYPTEGAERTVPALATVVVSGSPGPLLRSMVTSGVRTGDGDGF